MTSYPRIKFGEFYAEPVRNGLTRPTRVRGNGYRMVNMGELFAFDRLNDQPMERVPLNERELQVAMLRVEDLLFARSSLKIEGTGKCSIVIGLPEPTTFESRLIRTRLDRKRADPRYYFYFFQSYTGRATVLSNAKQVGAAGLPGSKLAGLDVPHPTLNFQERIADVLWQYDDLIENNRRRIQLLEAAARLLYKEWFVHLRFPGHEHVKIIDGVPEGWRNTALGKLCTFRAGGTFKPKYQGQSEGNFPFIKVRDLSREGNAITITGADNWVTLDECEEFRGRPFSRGTSVFAKIGEGLRQNRVRFIVRDTLIDNNMMGAIPDRRVTVSEYLYLLLRGHDLARYAGGAAVPFLSAKVLEGVGVLAPSMRLLSLFQDAVTPTFQQIVVLEQQSAAAGDARDLLLPRLMTGEMPV